MLKDYIEAVARRIIADKRQRGVVPDCASEDEILLEIKADTRECLRSLCQEKAFRGSVNINKIPLLFLPPQDAAQDK